MMFVLRRVPFFVFIHPGLRYFSPYVHPAPPSR
jgi:hypothetical protein